MIDFRLFDDLDAVEADAAHALDRVTQASLYDRIEWLRAHARHGLAPGAAWIARARTDGATAWLFLADEGRGRAAAFASWYTLSFAPVWQGGDATDRARLLRAIAGGLRGRFGRIVLAPLPADAVDAMETAFAAAGWWVDRQESSANWVAHVAGEDFATYWARRPSRLRNTARRKARDAGLEIAIHDGFDAAAWAAYEAVYAGSWKPNEGSPAFLREMAEREGAAGCLRLAVATREGRPVAAQMWTVEHGTATIHKLAYVETERARSPGTVLSEVMFRHVIERDCPALIDFGTGDDAYKADWMDEKRPLYRLTLHDPRSVAGLAGAARARIARWRAAR
ncbi:GNAT family N-acetyltransferase [Sphingomonas solaris]|uniref:GNAT family N-acetyltransferase n=1 Tax=Alterirhizorhabdus solaris TaxID=2529389 RepID=UPI00139696B0|nr:GNAT family N-acetyltransferase [Sphingomonas solaris]